MSRVIKKIVYGVFYLAVLSLILIGIYNTTVKPAPTCSDGKMNQGEAGIDCGGPCDLSCEILNLQPIKAVGEVKFFGSASGKTAVLGEALNSNLYYGVSQISYSFKFYDADDRIIKTFSDSETFYPGERKFIYAPNIDIAASAVNRIDLEFYDPVWQRVEEFIQYNLSIDKVETIIDEKSIVVRGVVKNQNSFSVNEIKLIAVVFNNLGEEIFAASTLATNINGLGEKSFFIAFPPALDLINQIDRIATKVFLSSR